MQIRNKMRAENNDAFVPVTVDELMYQFCSNERRKEIKKVYEVHNDELMKSTLLGKSNLDIETHVREVFNAYKAMLNESMDEFSRFRNE